MSVAVIDKVVLITGAASGIGLSMAEAFLSKGAKLVFILDINEVQGKEAEKKLKDQYGNDKVVFIKCNVGTDLEKVYDEVTKISETIDVVINNAGVQNEKNINKTIDINVVALMEWTMKFYERFRKDRGGPGGTIINVSSIFAYRIEPFIPYYHASKFAVMGFSRSLGHQYNYKKSGVRVITLCPGLTVTPMATNPNVLDDEAIDDLRKSLSEYEWQEVDAMGRGTVEVYQNAESGSAWVVEGDKTKIVHA
ncbi:unnamed protein product [Leptidea sinapis]|uniref:Alcohol dehydrogenase n=1 Tax=Leptidea sinapis TaxID=189913 RepID=A0A5E4PVM2_9NEOP|nr:unnamed protein product [Leptidea sinapis]